MQDYQRLRVEHVCDRLGLSSLAYMWRHPQQPLLRTMIQRGVDAVVVKIAAMGLNAEHLGHSIVQLEPLLCELEEKYGNHAAGEGGEYESLTLDCPLFTQRLVIDESHTIVHSSDQFAPVAFLRIDAFHLEKKVAQLPAQELDEVAATASEFGAAAATDVLLNEWRECAERWCRDLSAATRPMFKAGSCFLDLSCSIAQDRSSSDKSVSARRFSAPDQFMTGKMTNAQADQTTVHARATAAWGTGISEAAAAVMESVAAQLSQARRGWRDVYSACIYLGDLRDFAAFNRTYCSYFNEDPPSRVCVGIGASQRNRVVVECLASAVDRRVLHVRSISLWAPACIGPYSQASTVSGLLHCAGQIPLLPASMLLAQPREAVWAEALRCLESCGRVLDVHSSSLSRVIGGVIFISAMLVSHEVGQGVARLLAAVLADDAGNPPSLTVVAVASLPKDSAVEIQIFAEDIALVERGNSKAISSQLWKNSLPLSGTSAQLAVQSRGRFGHHCVVSASVLFGDDNGGSTAQEWEAVLQPLFHATAAALTQNGLVHADCIFIRVYRTEDAALPFEQLQAIAAPWFPDARIAEVCTLHPNVPWSLQLLANRPRDLCA